MTTPRKLFYYNAGFLRQRRLRRILSLAGYRVSLELPEPDDMVAVWGQSPNQYCGQAPLLRVEDAFLRSGRAGDPPLGLVLDRSGCHFDASQLSYLENTLSHDALDDSNLMHRSAQAITRMRDSHISKYNAFETTKPPPGVTIPAQTS